MTFGTNGKLSKSLLVMLLSAKIRPDASVIIEMLIIVYTLVSLKHVFLKKKKLERHSKVYHSAIYHAATVCTKQCWEGIKPLRQAQAQYQPHPLLAFRRLREREIPGGLGVCP